MKEKQHWHSKQVYSDDVSATELQHTSNKANFSEQVRPKVDIISMGIPVI